MTFDIIVNNTTAETISIQFMSIISKNIFNERFYYVQTVKSNSVKQIDLVHYCIYGIVLCLIRYFYFCNRKVYNSVIVNCIKKETSDAIRVNWMHFCQACLPANEYHL